MAMRPETVLITGASSGIGRELARCFAAEGCALILVARSTAALQSLAAELRQNRGVAVTVMTFDLAEPTAAREIVAAVTDQGLAVDVLVNNAGFGALGPFAELPIEREIAMVQVNITALMELTARFLPGMLARRRGGILNVGSVAGFVPGPGMAVYFATKAFVGSFTEALAEELRGSGVVISVLCPGPTESNFGVVANGGRERAKPVGKISAETVAVAGHRAFRRRQVTIITGRLNWFGVFLLRLLPRPWPPRLVGRHNRVV